MAGLRSGVSPERVTHDFVSWEFEETKEKKKLVEMSDEPIDAPLFPRLVAACLSD